MNSEERIYKQVEELSSSIITALEALEKELSEYIEVTDRRLKKLEEKVQNIESLAIVSEKGLLGTKSENSNSNIMRQADIANNVPKPSETQPTKPVIPPSIEEKPGLDKKQTTSFKPPEQESKHIIPPVPKPPSFEPKEKNSQQSTIPPQIKKPSPQDQKPPVVEEGKKTTEDEQEKEDLMEALKLIDSL